MKIFRKGEGLPRNKSNFEHYDKILELDGYGLSLQAIADAVGVSKASVQRILDSKRVVDEQAESLKRVIVGELLGDLAKSIRERIADHRRLIAEQGSVLLDAKGKTYPHPLLSQVRADEAQLVRLTREPLFPRESKG